MNTAPLIAHGDKQKVENSKQLSALVRTLSLTAFTSAWLLAGALNDEATNAYAILRLLRESTALHVTAGAAVLALGFDVMHYAAGTVAWNVWSWSAANLARPDADPSSKTYRLAYRIATSTGLVNHELAVTVRAPTSSGSTPATPTGGPSLTAPPPVTTATPGPPAGSRAATLLTPAEFHDALTNRHTAVVERFDIEGATGIITLLPTMFFYAKVVALVVSWVALLIHVL